MSRFRVLFLAAAAAAACNAGASIATNGTDPDVGTTPGAGRDAAAVGDDGGPRDSGVPDAPFDVDPGEPHVQLVGRFDTRVAGAPKCAWPGCRIVARFEGTEVKVRLAEEFETWMEGAPSEWDATVDGVTQKLTMQLGAHDYVLATSLPAGPHVVELYKRSEAQTGTTQFLGFDFGVGATLLAPPARKVRRIEIVGDSQPAAFGIEGLNYPQLDCPDADHAGRWQNFRKSFGARLGDLFDAEVAGTVYSGKGVAKNIWAYDDETMPLIFDRALPIDPTSAWDLTAYVPDVVVIMMGGNDFAIKQPVDTGPATLEQFTNAYRAFVGSIRAAYPNAHVIFALSPSISDDMPPGMFSRTNVKSGVTTVTNERVAAGDTKVSFIEPAVAVPSELTGCNGHGNPAFHDRVAQEIAITVRAKTGWQ